MPDQTAIIAKPTAATGELYQVRGLKALPLLVRQAWAGQTIFYSEIASELGMTNPRNMNYVLGAVGRSLQDLSREWGETIPPLQVLAINKGAGLPGEGFAEFLVNPQDYRSASPVIRGRIISALTSQVRAFPRWRQVLVALGATQPAAIDLGRLCSPALLATMSGGGESEAHRLFKLFVERSPGRVGVAGRNIASDIEHCLPSADKVDVLFTTPSRMVAVEVKSRVSSFADIVRGIFQCVKYRALLDAVTVVEQREVSVDSVLALEGRFPDSLRVIANTLGVAVFDNLGEHLT